MSALKRRIQSPLPSNLYWFCYRREEINSLPDWLKSSQSVYFVVPPQQISREMDALHPDMESHVMKRVELSLPLETKEYSGEKTDKSTSSAQQVLDKLIKIFGLKSPELTRDPLGFFAKHMRNSLVPDDNDIVKNESGIYLIGYVIERIEQANKQYISTIPEIESQLEKVRDAVRRTQYHEAINLAVKIDKNPLTPTQLRGLMDVAWSATSNLYDNSNEELNGYDLIIALGNMLLEHDNDKPALREQVATALVNKGITLGTLNRSEEAIAVYDDVVKRFGEATEPALRELVAKALVNKGVILLQQRKNIQALQCFSGVVEFCGDTQGAGLQLAKITAFSGLQRFDEAEQLLKQLAEKSTIDPQTSGGFLSDLELMASAPQPPEGILQFLEQARNILRAA